MSTCWEYRRGETMLAFLTDRPGYCDRGRWGATVDAPHSHSDADPWPRYYFDAERGKAEVLEYMRAKRIEIEGGQWHCVVYGHPQENEAFTHFVETGDPGAMIACRMFSAVPVAPTNGNPQPPQGEPS